ncbi:spore coat polysaccharide biosynthesis protein SpsF [Clostridium cavendishii DSM 21758]|uniref:Spore coat polysaccharide biosynthesis protein SpsF n=1 Tax=Clostridium cavendishii DSM 21758 TaxID=1121302 RepID=A0A1M6AXA2_9CLOT|nr:glycosyltransferase family protein [Clostridium cavendishii]SHI40843.1 spore coat polysaccharide biosynthesis protein SpsF [Clostridium cavendishii DSM 21758]
MNIAIIQAHMGSTRLPGKIMKKMCDKEVLVHVYERCKRSKKLDKIIIATSTNKENDEIETLCEKYNIECFRGSEDDVLDRYYKCAKKYNPKIIVRITSDCPLLEPKLIDYWVENLEKDELEFVEEEKEIFIGFGLDIFTMEALEKLKKKSTEAKQKEHVIGYYLEHKNEFTNKKYPLKDNLNYLYRPYRLTLDTSEDYELIKKIYEKFYKHGFVNLEEVIKYIDKDETLLNINKNIKQKKYII